MSRTLLALWEHTTAGADDFMNIQILDCFIALTEEQDIGKAASRLDVSPRELTKQIQTLEKELGLILFSHDQLATDAAKTFLPHARGIIREIEKVKEEICRIGELLARPAPARPYMASQY